MATPRKKTTGEGAAIPDAVASPDAAEVGTETTVPEPVHTIKVVHSGDEPVRAGGHILTEDGWVLEASVQQ